MRALQGLRLFRSGRCPVFISTRRAFSSDDEGWSKYVTFIGLRRLQAVRSVDAALNERVGDCPSFEFASREELQQALTQLPAPASPAEYRLIWLDAQRERLPEWLADLALLLGHDLADETNTSSLLNCGQWTGALAAFPDRANAFGLLTFEDAVKAQAALPQAWPGDPHAQARVLALYELRRG